MLNELNKNTLDFAEHRHPCFKMKECFSISNSILDLLKSLCFLFYISSKFHCVLELWFLALYYSLMSSNIDVWQHLKVLKRALKLLNTDLRKSNSVQKPWSPELLMDEMAFNQNNILLPWFLTSRQLTVLRNKKSFI